MAGPSSSSSSTPAKRRFYNRFHILGSFLLGCCVATFGITCFHFATLSDFHQQLAAAPAAAGEANHHNLASVAKVHQKEALEKHAANNNNNNNNNNKSSQEQKLAYNHDSLVHPVAGLDCSEHGGPETAQELVYWKDIEQDNVWTSPFMDPNERRYLTFEPDGGGWNNIRMSMETVLTMALAMGRVLVLPPSQKMYLLGKTTFNFADFFPLQELAEEHAGLEIISTEQFLQETMGKTVHQETGELSFPPDNKKTSWDGDTGGIKGKLAPWIRSIATMPDWNPSKCIAAFPKSKDPKDAQQLQQEFDEILAERDGFWASNKAHQEYINQPTPVDASSKDRLREFNSERTKLCVYDAKLQEAPIIHFHGKHKSEHAGGRLLVHFYAFLFFQDHQVDLWMKRFVRDHVRYIDNIQCAAARIVHKLRTKYGGTYDSFHIRRGDFQYKATRVDADVIVQRARDVIEEGRVVYVGTDERNKNFFKPLVEQAGWNVLFLDDFLEEVGESIDPHYYGMIDQLVVSKGDRFFGCWFSTFSGYIMRLRGYHSQNEIASGGPNAQAFLEGKLPNSYYYALEDHKTKMHDYWPVKPVFYAREFPIAWRQLDVE